MRNWFRILLAVVVAVPLACLQARADEAPGAAAMALGQRVLAEAKAEAAQDCRRPSDILVHIICDGQIRIGLRTFYPGFSVRKDDGTFAGFEWDIAQRIAQFIGVKLVAVAVDPKNRIPLVAEHRIDVVIATMGHDTLRDREVKFIRPHYFMSQTVIVGGRDRSVTDWADLDGQTVCLPLGSSSNITFIRHHIPVLTFDRPEQLLDALAFKDCTFIVQDDTFFRKFITDPNWSSRFGIKFGFAPLPWGMAVARDGADKLAALLTDLSIAFHADGVFVDLARRNDLDVTFLETQQLRWVSQHCVTADGQPDEACLMPAAENANTSKADAIAPNGIWLGRSLSGWFGIEVGLQLLSSQASYGLLVAGIGYSLVLVIGSQLSTLAFALIFGGLMSCGPRIVRLPFAAVTAIGQTAPLPLLLFFGYVMAAGIMQYSGNVALAVAILIIGFYNGCNAAQAIHEAHRAILQRRLGLGQSAGAELPSYWYAVSIARTQIVAFLINAAKGSPAAGMIGVPEFLNVLTDLTSYSRDRVAVYLILLVFYTGLVLLVILLLSTGQALITRRVGRHA